MSNQEHQVEKSQKIKFADSNSNVFYIMSDKMPAIIP